MDKVNEILQAAIDELKQLVTDNTNDVPPAAMLQAGRAVTKCLKNVTSGQGQENELGETYDKLLDVYEQRMNG
jgi:hypothetical protein